MIGLKRAASTLLCGGHSNGHPSSQNAECASVLPSPPRQSDCIALCVVDYAIETREWRETGEWVEICGINGDYCWRGDGLDSNASSISFAPIVIFPSRMLLRDIPSYLLRIPEHIARINSNWADFTPRSCMIQDDTWRTVVNCALDPISRHPLSPKHLYTSP